MFDLETFKKALFYKGLGHFSKFCILWKEDRYLKNMTSL